MMYCGVHGKASDVCMIMWSQCEVGGGWHWFSDF